MQLSKLTCLLMIDKKQEDSQFNTWLQQLSTYDLSILVFDLVGHLSSNTYPENVTIITDKNVSYKEAKLTLLKESLKQQPDWLLLLQPNDYIDIEHIPFVFKQLKQLESVSNNITILNAYKFSEESQQLVSIPFLLSTKTQPINQWDVHDDQSPLPYPVYGKAKQLDLFIKSTYHHHTLDNNTTIINDYTRLHQTPLEKDIVQTIKKEIPNQADNILIFSEKTVILLELIKNLPNQTIDIIHHNENNTFFSLLPYQSHIHLLSDITQLLDDPSKEKYYEAIILTSPLSSYILQQLFTMLSSLLSDEGIFILTFENERHFSHFHDLTHPSSIEQLFKETNALFNIEKMTSYLYESGFSPIRTISLKESAYQFDLPENQQQFAYEEDSFILKNISREQFVDYETKIYVIKSQKKQLVLNIPITLILIYRKNTYQLLEEFVKYFKQSTIGHFNIILISESDQIPDLLQYFPYLSTIYIKESELLVSALNQALSEYNEHHYLILDTKTYVMDHWFQHLLHPIEIEKIGIAMSQTISQPSNKEAYMTILQNMGHTSAQSMQMTLPIVINKNLLNTIGFFDNELSMETAVEDYSIRALLSGYQVQIIQDSLVYRSAQEGNNEREFENKWGLSFKEAIIAYQQGTLHSHIKEKVDNYYISLDKMENQQITVFVYVKQGNHDYLTKTMLSIEKQQVLPSEVIVIDFNDSISSWKEELHGWSFPVSYYSPLINEDRWQTMRKSLALASMPLIAFIQEGDIYYPHHLSTLQNQFSNKEVATVYSEIYIDDHEPRLPLLAFMIKRELIYQIIQQNENLSNPSQETFYLPLLKELTEMIDFVKVDDITGESGGHLFI